MRLIPYIYSITLFCSISTCFGQVSDRELEKLNVILDESVKTNSFPDSTALYTGQIQITIAKKTNYVPVIKSTDTALTNKLHLVEMLTKYNYNPLMMKTKVIHLVIPIAITTVGFKDRPNARISTDSISKKISKFFDLPMHIDNNQNVQYLRPLIYTIENSKWDYK
jgi:hypothetical protein